MDNLNSPSIVSLANSLTNQAGIPAVKDVIPILEGRNNKVFRVKSKNYDYLMKIYFRSKKDLRNRLATEFQFLKFAWEHGERCIPQPIVYNKHDNTALYSFIPGKKLVPSLVTQYHVKQASSFFIRLNKLRLFASELPHASDSCFTFEDHIKSIQYRLNNLLKNIPNEDSKKILEPFVAEILFPKFEITSSFVLEKLGDQSKVPLPQQKRCISPSDFGFHNALINDEGRLFFIDFEYAGWDDPIKMLCDFYCQPDIPAPLNSMFSFTHAISNYFDIDKKLLVDTFNLFFPLYKIKWCCIILNDFIGIGQCRRQYSGINSTVHQRNQQLHKALSYYDSFFSK